MDRSSLLSQHYNRPLETVHSIIHGQWTLDTIVTSNSVTNPINVSRHFLIISSVYVKSLKVGQKVEHPCLTVSGRMSDDCFPPGSAHAKRAPVLMAGCEDCEDCEGGRQFMSA